MQVLQWSFRYLLLKVWILLDILVFSCDVVAGAPWEQHLPQPPLISSVLPRGSIAWRLLILGPYACLSMRFNGHHSFLVQSLWDSFPSLSILSRRHCFHGGEHSMFRGVVNTIKFNFLTSLCLSMAALLSLLPASDPSNFFYCFTSFCVNFDCFTSFYGLWLHHCWLLCFDS